MHDDRRMGWAPHAQMIAEALPAAPKAKPPALVRRSATEFKIDGCVVHSSDIRHVAAQRHFTISGSGTDGAGVSTMFDPLYAGGWPKIDPGVRSVTAVACGWHECVPSTHLDSSRVPSASAEPEWIEWAGGECPLPRGTRHAVRMRCGDGHPDLSYPQDWRWSHLNNGGDIVAYRVLPEPSAPKADADGWVAWGGIGDRPIASDTHVELRYADGSEDYTMQPQFRSWSWSWTMPAQRIVAYRVLP